LSASDGFTILQNWWTIKWLLKPISSRLWAGDLHSNFDSTRIMPMSDSFTHEQDGIHTLYLRVVNLWDCLSEIVAPHWLT
jgi:hypothetical protein